MNCSTITAGLIAVVCGKPETAGTGSRVWLINYDDIDRAESVITNNVISDLILADTKKAYLFETIDNSTLGETSLNKGTFMSNFQHDLTLRIFAKSEAAKAFVNSLNGARVVAVVENKALTGSGATLGETKFEAYGWDAGLELNELASTTEMTDMVVYQPKIGSGTAKESSLPKSVFKTSLAVTETMLDSLIA